MIDLSDWFSILSCCFTGWYLRSKDIECCLGCWPPAELIIRHGAPYIYALTASLRFRNPNNRGGLRYTFVYYLRQLAQWTKQLGKGTETPPLLFFMFVLLIFNANFYLFQFYTHLMRILCTISKWNIILAMASSPLGRYPDWIIQKYPIPFNPLRKKICVQYCVHNICTFIFEEANLEVPTIYKAYVTKIWPQRWYSTSILGWNCYWYSWDHE